MNPDNNPLNRMTKALVLGKDRTYSLNYRLSVYQKAWPDIFQSDAVHAFWSDLLMEIELGRDLQDVLQIPYNVPGPKFGPDPTIEEYLKAFHLRYFLETPTNRF